MKIRKTRFLVVGAGTAGLGARRAIAAHTDDYLVADPGPLGTTCARVGCMPSKLLIAAADRAFEVEEPERFGVHSMGVSVDGKAVLRRVQQERDRFVGFVVRDMDDWASEHLLPHGATFVGPMAMKVGDEVIEAERIVLAVGSRPSLPASVAGLGDALLTTDGLFELPDLPFSVAVLGAGVIGLEMGQALHRLGRRVKVFGRSRSLGGIGDEIIRAEAATILGQELDLHLTSDLELKPGDEGVDVSWNDDHGQGEASFERLLVCTGRRSNLDRLALERSGLAMDEEGVPLHDVSTLACEGMPVFLAGDDREDKMILHEASDEGRIAGTGAVEWPHPVAGARRVPLTIVFCEPNIIQAGISPREVDPTRHGTGVVSFWDQGRSRVMGLNKGRLHIYGEKGTRRLLGACGIGPRLEHIGHLLAWAVGAGLTVDQALDMPFYHPVIEEGVRTALRDLKRHL